MTEPMKVLFVASEAMPFVKTGGLADVAYALPKALSDLGVDVRVMIPMHRAIKEKYGSQVTTLTVSEIGLSWRRAYLGVQTMELDGLTYYFIDNEDFFGGEIYRGGDAESEQYLFFCKAVLEALLLIDFKPDLIHTNDWHTGMIPMLLKTQHYGNDLGNPKTVLTIHNIKFQGMMGFDRMTDFLSIPEKYNTPEFIEAHGAANMLKTAIVFSDRITTVSPTYAKEIMSTPYYGMGMEGILWARRDHVWGIANGIDEVDFDPAADAAIAKNYDVDSIIGKRENKKALREEYDLDITLYDPVIAMVTRLTDQKGLSLVQYVLEELLQEDVAFVLLGSGDQKYVDFFNHIAAKYPGKSGVYIGYDEERAHRIYAGSDFLLMPSLFEPCGLSQMIAQRYGTLPIVRETGGLIDTVVPYNQYTNTGDGFSFGPYNAHDMLKVIRIALATYKNKPVLRRLKKNAMMKDNSFLKSAQKYIELYGSI